MNTNTKRQSNFELLRVLCIIGIVCMHIMGIIYQSVNGYNRIICIFLNSIFNANVSIFLLISGFFGIKNNFSKLLSMEWMVLFYSILNFIITLFLHGDDINNISLCIHFLKGFFPTLTNKFWFFSGYVILFFLAPYIEMMFEKLSQKLVQRFILILLFFFSIAPSVLYLEILGDAGKGIVNVILVYMIGRYFHYYGIPAKLEKHHIKFLLLFIPLSTILNTLLSIKLRPQGLVLNFARDNCILTIGIAICIFIWFKNITIYSTILNKLACFVFPIYLVNESLRELINFKYPFSPYQDTPYMILALTVYTIITVIIGILIELIRRLLFTKLEKMLISCLKKHNIS